jgi:hypothetical protein
MNYKFKSKEFNEFKAAVVYWLNRFAITGWDILIVHKQIEEGALAQCHYDTVSKNCIFSLTKETDGFESSMSMNRLALHEVIHLLVADLVHVCTVSEDQEVIVGIEHAMINRVINALESRK